MAKSANAVDVLVLGSHPSASLAAALLRQNSSTRVMCGLVPGEAPDDRLVAFNAELFELHPLLAGLKKKLELAPYYGLRFLGDDSKTHSEYSGKDIAAYVGSMKAIRQHCEQLAEEAGAESVENQRLSIERLDEHGVEVWLDDQSIKPKLLIVAAELPTDARRVLGLPPSWEAGVPHRYTYIKCKTTARIGFNGTNASDPDKPLLVMSLDLKGQLTWAWALYMPGCVQFAVEQPIDSSESPNATALLRHWLDVLEEHDVIKSAGAIDLAKSESMLLPLAGALSQEGVANRTLLIGPAGGFYTACAEDIYPACWSAIYAVDTAKKALKEKHLQDALQPYRHKWGATLGDYLRGPQQNLRFLLPLVYRNKVMTARLAEAILFGKSVVR